MFNDAYLVYDGGVNHSKGTGRLNVSDIDGDGQMNTTYVSDQILYALDENLNVLWTKGIDEGSSGFTGTTVFDFDGDGAAETIYRSTPKRWVFFGFPWEKIGFLLQNHVFFLGKRLVFQLKTNFS